MHRTSKLLKSVSLTLVLCFLLQDISLAAGELSFFKDPQTDLKEARNTLKLPKSFGSVTDAYLDRTKPLVLLIEDPHANPSGQMNLAKTLDHLLKTNDIPYVFIEAGSGNDSLTHYRQYADSKDRKRISKEYLQKALLHGEEYLDINSDHHFTIWGVEDPFLYTEALELYRKVAQHRSKFELYLGKIQVTLNLLSQKELNPVLLSLETNRKNYFKKTLSFTSYADSLLSIHQSLNLQSNYPNLTELKNLKNFEDSLKNLKNPRHKAALLNRKIQKSLDYDALLKELSTLEKELEQALTVTDDQKTLIKALRTFELYQKLLDLQLSPEDYQAYKEQGLSPEQLTGFLNRQILNLGDYYETALFLEPGFKEILKDSQAFYELTLKRDQAFIKNLKAKATTKPSVLIAGGYHTPNLKSLLKAQGYSYIDIIPSVTQETNFSRYENVLLNQTPSPIKLQTLNLKTQTMRAGPEFTRGVVGARLMDSIPAADLTSRINALSASELEAALRKAFKTGKVRPVRRLNDWKRLPDIVEGDKKMLVAGVIVLRKINGRWSFLLGRRGKRSDNSGKFVIPGGKVDEKEDPKQAAVRELFEETRINISKEKLSGRLDDVPGRHIGILLNNWLYIDESTDPAVELTEEIDAHAWIPLDTILDLEGEDVGEEILNHLQIAGFERKIMSGEKKGAMPALAETLRLAFNPPTGRIADDFRPLPADTHPARWWVSYQFLGHAPALLGDLLEHLIYRENTARIPGMKQIRPSDVFGVTVRSPLNRERSEGVNSYEFKKLNIHPGDIVQIVIQNGARLRRWVLAVIAVLIVVVVPIWAENIHTAKRNKIWIAHLFEQAKIILEKAPHRYYPSAGNKSKLLTIKNGSKTLYLLSEYHMDYEALKIAQDFFEQQIASRKLPSKSWVFFVENIFIRQAWTKPLGEAGGQVIAIAKKFDIPLEDPIANQQDWRMVKILIEKAKEQGISENDVLNWIFFSKIDSLFPGVSTTDERMIMVSVAMVTNVWFQKNPELMKRQSEWIQMAQKEVRARQQYDASKNKALEQLGEKIGALETEVEADLVQVDLKEAIQRHPDASDFFLIVGQDHEKGVIKAFMGSGDGARLSFWDGSAINKFVHKAIEIGSAKYLKWQFRGVQAPLEDKIRDFRREHGLDRNFDFSRLDREEQRLLAREISPIIQKWVVDNRSRLLKRLPSLIGYPQGQEQYHRNLVVKTADMAIFAHVWKPLGETRIHNHGGIVERDGEWVDDGVLGVTIPLEKGLVEDEFEFATDPGFEPLQDRRVRLVGKGTHVADPERTSVILKGNGSIHRVRNISKTEPKIMLEFYFPPLKGGLNTFVPIQEVPGEYLVRYDQPADINLSLSDAIKKEAFLEDAGRMLSELVKTGAAPQIYTEENTVLSSERTLARYLEKGRRRVLKNRKTGEYLLVAAARLAGENLGFRKMGKDQAVWVSVSRESTFFLRHRGKLFRANFSTSKAHSNRMWFKEVSLWDHGVHVEPQDFLNPGQNEKNGIRIGVINRPDSKTLTFSGDGRMEYLVAEDGLVVKQLILWHRVRELRTELMSLPPYGSRDRLDDLLKMVDEAVIHGLLPEPTLPLKANREFKVYRAKFPKLEPRFAVLEQHLLQILQDISTVRHMVSGDSPRLEKQLSETRWEAKQKAMLASYADKIEERAEYLKQGWARRDIAGLTVRQIHDAAMGHATIDPGDALLLEEVEALYYAALIDRFHLKNADQARSRIMQLIHKKDTAALMVYAGALETLSHKIRSRLQGARLAHAEIVEISSVQTLKSLLAKSKKELPFEFGIVRRDLDSPIWYRSVRDHLHVIYQLAAQRTNALSIAPEAELYIQTLLEKESLSSEDKDETAALLVFILIQIPLLRNPKHEFIWDSKKIHGHYLSQLPDGRMNPKIPGVDMLQYREGDPAAGTEPGMTQGQISRLMRILFSKRLGFLTPNSITVAPIKTSSKMPHAISNNYLYQPSTGFVGGEIILKDRVATKKGKSDWEAYFFQDFFKHRVFPQILKLYAENQDVVLASAIRRGQEDVRAITEREAKVASVTAGQIADTYFIRQPGEILFSSLPPEFHREAERLAMRLRPGLIRHEFNYFAYFLNANTPHTERKYFAVTKVFSAYFSMAVLPGNAYAVAGEEFPEEWERFIRDACLYVTQRVYMTMPPLLPESSQNYSRAVHERLAAGDVAFVNAPQESRSDAQFAMSAIQQHLPALVKGEPAPIVTVHTEGVPVLISADPFELGSEEPADIASQYEAAVAHYRDVIDTINDVLSGSMPAFFMPGANFQSGVVQGMSRIRRLGYPIRLLARMISLGAWTELFLGENFLRRAKLAMVEGDPKAAEAYSEQAFTRMKRSLELKAQDQASSLSEKIGAPDNAKSIDVIYRGFDTLDIMDSVVVAEPRHKKKMDFYAEENAEEYRSAFGRYWHRGDKVLDKTRILKEQILESFLRDLMVQVRGLNETRVLSIWRHHLRALSDRDIDRVFLSFQLQPYTGEAQKAPAEVYARLKILFPTVFLEGDAQTQRIDQYLSHMNNGEPYQTSYVNDYDAAPYGDAERLADFQREMESTQKMLAEGTERSLDTAVVNFETAFGYIQDAQDPEIRKQIFELAMQNARKALAQLSEVDGEDYEMRLATACVDMLKAYALADGHDEALLRTHLLFILKNVAAYVGYWRDQDGEERPSIQPLQTAYQELEAALGETAKELSGYFEKIRGAQAVAGGARLADENILQSYRFLEEGERGPAGIYERTSHAANLAEEIVEFGVKVYRAQKKEGLLAVGEALYELQYDATKRELLIVDKRSGDSDKVSIARPVVWNEEGREYRVSATLTELQTAIQLAKRENAALISNLPEAVVNSSTKSVIELNIYHLLADPFQRPLLVAALKKVRNTALARNSKIVLEASAKNDLLVAELLSNFEDSQDWIVGSYEELSKRFPDYHKDAQRVRIGAFASNDGMFSVNERFLVTQKAGACDIFNYEGILQAALLESKISEDALKNPSLSETQKLLHVFSALLGRTVSSEQFEAFLKVVLGKGSNEELAKVFAVPPIFRVPIEAKLQAARLTKMMEMSA